MAEPNRSSSPKQVFDVAKPNKSRPSNTTKSVIVTNRPILQDPMVNAVESNDGPTTAPPLAIKLSSKIRIQPLTSSAELTESGEPVAVKQVAIDTAMSLAPDVASPISEHLEKARAEAIASYESEESLAAATVAATDEPKLTIDADSPAKTTDGVAFKAGTAPIGDTPKDGALVTENDLAVQEDENDAYDENIQKLVTEKRYFLPINSQEKRRTKRFIILGVVLILLLAVAWTDIALDAGLIHLHGIKPLTHLFSN